MGFHGVGRDDELLGDLRCRAPFNEEAQRYNTAVRRFPGNLIAGLFGFDRKPYFESAEGTEAAPEVQF